MKINILYGEMGAGKNYQGTRLADLLGVPFFDGDDVIPPEMGRRIAAFRPITPAMIENYIRFNLAPSIISRREELVVAQALYLRNHRELLEGLLRGAGLDVEFGLIRVPFWQHMRQLWSRPNGLYWVFFALMNKPFFQR